MLRTSLDPDPFFVHTTIAQLRYLKIQRKTIDITTRLQGINPKNSTGYSLEPRAEVSCLTLSLLARRTIREKNILLVV